MSVNTVRKHICSLADKGLISTGDTVVYTRNSLKRNGSLMCTILPIQEALDAHNRSQLRELEIATARMGTVKNCVAVIKKGPRDRSQTAVWPRS